ncbi:Sec1-like protein [Rozella allomycis CSF55]|uniref:Sec1-like protein n=1 Tax=Rozella allomycis (strain CSF55) TaxID=988480 RepID=A0A4P9YMW4_ROZAC|nr:Sec1-like protein [Rozella allomycis CSF55]
MVKDSHSPGKKALVLDSSLSGPLSLIAEFSLLKEHGIEKIYHIESESLQLSNNQVLFLIRPTIKATKMVRALESTEVSKISVYYAPKRSAVSERILEEESVYGKLHIGEFFFDLVPMDKNIFSFELNDSFKSLFIDNDIHGISDIAKGLIKLCSLAGYPVKVQGRGSCSKMVADVFQRLRKESERITPKKHRKSGVDSLIILDRTVDLLTPLLTPLTYEAVLDHLFKIKNNFINFEANVLADPNNRKISLENDPVYHEIKYKHLSTVSQSLNLIANNLKEGYGVSILLFHQEEYKTANGINELHKFVSKLGNLQSQKTCLEVHIKIIEEINKIFSSLEMKEIIENEQLAIMFNFDEKEFIETMEEMIFTKAPFCSTVKLLALVSQTQNGLKKKHFDYLKDEIVNTYGFESLFSLLNYEKIGLIKQDDSSKNPFPTIKKNLNLTPENTVLETPVDPSYVFSGIAPLSVRLIQQSIEDPKPSSSSIFTFRANNSEEYLSKFSGTPFDFIENETNHALDKAPSIITQISTVTLEKKTTIVCFLGGITRSEIAALKLLESIEDQNREFIIVTSDIINSESFLSQFEKKFI